MNMRERCLAFLRSRPDLSYGDLTAHTNLGESTGRSFLSGCIDTPRCRAEFERVIGLAERGEILRPAGAAANVLMMCEERSDGASRVPKRREIYQTDTVRRVAQVLTYCHEQAAIGVITGGYGTGKSEAINAWRRGAGRSVECMLFEFDEFTCGNKIAFIQGVAETLGLPIARGPQNGAKVFKAVVEHLREHPHFLVFDQAEMVRVRVFQVFRQIWDRTRDVGVGVGLSAAPTLLLRLKGSGSQDLGALVSRVGIWAPLQGVSRAEMAAIVKQEGICEVDEGAFEVWWQAVGGSMRRLMAGIDLIRAKHQGKQVTSKTISGVAGCLWGMNVRAAA